MTDSVADYQKILDENKAESLGDCPFCKGTLAASLEGAKEQFVIHSLPYCSQFADNEPIKFVTMIRKAKQC